MQGNAFAFGLFDFLRIRRHFGQGAAVEDAYLRTQTLGGPGHVKSHIAPADDHHFFANLGLFPQGKFSQQINTLHNPLSLFAGDVHGAAHMAT